MISMLRGGHESPTMIVKPKELSMQKYPSKIILNSVLTALESNLKSILVA